MPSQSINTEIIKLPDTITQSSLSETFALLLIKDHEMIDNFSGIGTGEGGRGGGEGRYYVLCHRSHAMMILFFLKDRSSLQYFIRQGKGQSSMSHTFRTVCNFRGRTWASGRVGGGEEESKGSIPVFYEACLKT